MVFKDDYISEADNIALGNKDKKKIIGNDAFAVCTMIEALMEKLNYVRILK